MITHLRIENFKSLVEFDLPEQPQRLGKFVCLVGMNGSGKTTVLQALDFLAHLMQGKVRDWLERRDWKAAEIACRIPKQPEWRKLRGENLPILKPWRPSLLTSFEIAIELDGQELVWRGKFNRSTLQCTSEEVTISGESVPLASHVEGTLQFAASDEKPLKLNTEPFRYEGSLFSVITPNDPLFQRFQDTVLGLKSFELLTPHAMRRRSRSNDDIGYGGEQLSGFLSRMAWRDRERLTETLKKFYPSLEKLSVTTVRGGWKKLHSHETQGVPVNVSATHMNDGMLRVVAILSQAYSKHPVLLFDEIENGINPELVEKLVDFLVAMKKQVIVTTHSPMILNYLEDKVARESVFLLYRDGAGWTRCVRFFDQPETSKKLEALGPGEVFADTNLTRLTKRLARKTAVDKRGAA